MEKQSKDDLASKKPKKDTVELIKYNQRSEIWYKITINGSYVENSCTQKVDDANEMYETVLQYGGLVKETVIRSHKIQKGGLNG